MKRLLLMIAGILALQAYGEYYLQYPFIKEFPEAWNGFDDKVSGLEFRVYGFNTNQVIIIDPSAFTMADLLCPYNKDTYEIPAVISSGDVEYSVVGVENNSFYMGPNWGPDYVSFPPTMRFIQGNCFNAAINTLGFSEGLERIAYNCFNFLGVRELKFPDSLVEIGESCFSSCSNLESIQFGKGLQAIGWNSFCDNDNLIEVEIPDCVHNLHQGLFHNFNNNKSLKKVTLGILPTQLNLYDCFNGCPEINLIVCKGPHSVSFENCFNDVDKSKCIVVVRDGSKEHYMRSDGWKDFIIMEESEYETHVKNLKQEKVTPDIFTLDGIKVNDESEVPHGEIYIKRHGSESTKIMK